MKKLLFLSFFLFLESLFAGIEDYKVGTWNMQGASARSESKWSVSVRQLMSGENSLNILMLQEAGSVPESAVNTGRRVQPGGTPVEEYAWQLGTLTRPMQVYIYHAPIDVGSRRVNLAIVSDRRADEVFVISQTSIAPEASRPALGIRIGNDVFFSIHALANGGGDATALVSAIHDNFTNFPNYTYMIAGDFNRSPASFLSGLPTRVETQIRLVVPRTPTHTNPTGSSNRILDYAVIGRTLQQGQRATLPQLIAFLVSSALTSFLVSDHFPVRFGKL